MEGEKKMKIRKARLKDLNIILKLLRTTPELHGVKGEPIYSKEYVIDSIKDNKRNVFFIAEENKKIMGFIFAEIWLKKKYSFLIDIVIVKEHRGRGVGKMLYYHYENYCRKKGIGIISALTQTKNKKTQEFNKRIGLKKGKSFYYYEKELR